MGKLLLAMWVYLGSFLGMNHSLTLLPDQKKLPNKLVITRSEDKGDHLSAFTITIIDEAKVRKLYEEIYVLPTFSPGTYNCPNMVSFAKYSFDFYLNNTLITHGVYQPSGCSSVTLGNTQARVVSGSFSYDFQHATGLSDSDFYGSLR